jgi:hypothetical protein
LPPSSIEVRDDRPGPLGGGRGGDHVHHARRKPLAEASGEVTYGGEFLRWFSEEAVRIGARFGTIGPCHLITPWNFPLVMATRVEGAAQQVGTLARRGPGPPGGGVDRRVECRDAVLGPPGRAASSAWDMCTSVVVLGLLLAP